jgi:hypothetical protein
VGIGFASLADFLRGGGGSRRNRLRDSSAPRRTGLRYPRTRKSDSSSSPRRRRHRVRRRNHPRPVYPHPQTLFINPLYQFEQLRHALGELVDLREGGGVGDGQPGVDVSLVSVDAQHDVDFYSFDVVSVLPRLAEGVGHAVAMLVGG